jgi:hypothetical protein
MSFISQRYITNAAIYLFASYLSESVRPFGVDMGKNVAVYLLLGQSPNQEASSAGHTKPVQ